MSRFRILLGVFIWVGIFTGGIVLYRHLPPRKVSSTLLQGEQILGYFQKNSLSIRVHFPQTYLFDLALKDEADLDKSKPSDDVIQEFRARNIFFSSGTVFETQKKDHQWIIRDEDKLQHYVIRREKKFLKVYQDVFLQSDDSVNFWNGETFVVIGRIMAKEAHPKYCRVVVEIFSDRAYLLTNKADFLYSQDNGTFGDIVDNLLAGKNGDKVKGEVNRILNQKKGRILEILTPVVEEVVESSMPYLKKGLTESIYKHQTTLGALVQQELLEKKLLPAIQKEAWPLIEKKAPPVLEPIAKQLWDQLPIAGIISREMLYKIYLSKKSGIDRWNEYVQKKAVPIITKNQDKLVKLARDIAEEIASKDSVIQALQEGSTNLFSHEKFKTALQNIFMEGILKNQELKKAFLDKWSTLESAISKISEELEAPIRRTVDLILLKDGDYRKGINPSLARVLRQQILWKDTQWIQVKAGSGNEPLKESMEFQGRIF